MKSFANVALILLIPAVSAWDRCYCTGDDQEQADRTASTCCSDTSGVSFPNTSGDVSGRWDGDNCVFSGAVLTQNSENDATAAFAACCRPTGGASITGGACFQP